VKRIFYFLAVVCLAGICVCAFRFASMPNTVGDAIEAVQDHDPAARELVEDAREPNAARDALLRDAGLCLAGAAVFVLLAKRVS
jgi:hypothetical protein